MRTLSYFAEDKRRRVSSIFFAFSFLIGALVMLGWHFDLPTLQSVFPGFITMKFNTAFCFVILSVAHFLIGLSDGRKFRSATGLCITTVAVISLLTLVQYGFDLNLGIDELVYRDPLGVAQVYPPGRLAPVTAVGFLLISLGTFVNYGLSKKRYRLGQILYLVMVLVSFQALTAYVVGVQTTFGIASYTRMAVHTAGAFIFLCSGCLVLFGNHGYMRLLLSNSSVGVAARNLIVLSIFVPPRFLFLERWGEKTGLISRDYSLLLRLIGGVCFFVFIIWRNAEKLHLANQKKARLDRQKNHLMAVQRINEGLIKDKSQFLTHISHEIRTPLNGVVGMTDLLSSTSLDDTQKSYLRTLEVSSQTLMHLVNNVLDLSKFEAGKLALYLSPFNLKSLVQDVSLLVSPEVRRKEINFNIQISSDCPIYLVGDIGRLRQILLNLASNAVKFTTYGEVRIEVSSIDLGSGRHRICFEVLDEGVGLSKINADELFQSYAQAKGTKNYAGTGLGLYISKQLVELMGGEIGAEPRSRRGSRFFFSVPLEETTIKAEPIHQKQMASARAFQVLVVEDVLINQKVLGEMLKSIGGVPSFAGNGNEALSILEKSKFDLILMDVQMDQMDGLETTRRIRQNPAMSQAPIVATTAHTLRENVEACYAAGMDDFLTKPILLKELQTKVFQWLNHQERKEVETRINEFIATLPANVVSELVSVFIHESSSLLSEVKTAMATENHTQVSKAAHKLKSACGNMGAQRIKQYAEKLEKDPKDQTSFSLLESGLSELVKELKGA